MTSMDCLPNELLRAIFIEIPQATWVIRAVCKLWRDLVPFKQGISCSAYWRELMTLPAIDMANHVACALVNNYEHTVNSLLWMRSENISRVAAKIGRVDILAAALDANCSMLDVITAALEGDQPGVTRWIKANWMYSIEWKRAFPPDRVARYGAVKVLEHLSSECVYIPRSVALTAIRHGHDAVFAWYASKKLPIENRVIEYAAYHGRLEPLKICKELGINAATNIFSIAACQGNRSVLKWLHDNGHPADRSVFICAARTGDIELLQWGATKVALDERTCEFVAVYGRLDMLIWLREQGCPWDSATCTASKNYGHFNVYLWARAHGCPDDEH